MLGSLICSVTLGLGATALIKKNLSPEHTWDSWTGTYPEVLDYLEDALRKTEKELRKSLPEDVEKDLSRAFAELCHPNLDLRGHPAARKIGTPLSLERYISLFDLLAKRLLVRKR